jgi:hypothetical protein
VMRKTVWWVSAASCRMEAMPSATIVFLRSRRLEPAAGDGLAAHDLGIVTRHIEPPGVKGTNRSPSDPAPPGSLRTV